MKTECTQIELNLQGLHKRRIIVRHDGEIASSDGGLILLQQIERRRAFIAGVAACCQDRRQRGKTSFSVAELLMQRVFGICLGYEDLNDHDEWRHDPLLNLVCGREQESGALAGKSTLNRLELSAREKAESDRYHRLDWDGTAIRQFFVDAFLGSYEQPPTEIVLDFDATDDPVHGEQEGRFFHGYYDEYCFLPLYVFCGEHLLAADLRTADQDAAAGSTPTLAFLVNRIREAWPDTKIIARADSGFCRDDFMTWCEEHEVEYVLGVARNSRLVRKLGPALREAREGFVHTGHGYRVFRELTYRTRSSWSRSRRVVGKAEHLEKGPNPRFVVTNLDTESWPAKELYEDLYCARGTMENRIKEQQLFLFADRTSCHAFKANQLRLWLSSVAYLFFVELRRTALTGTALATAQVSTIRLKLLKVAVTVSISIRRVVLRLTRAYPYWDLWRSCAFAFSSA
jgi:hypothetical protein